MKYLLLIAMLFALIFSESQASESTFTSSQKDSLKTGADLPVGLLTYRHGRIRLEETTLKPKRVKDLFNDYPDIYNFYVSGRTFKNTGTGLIFTGIVGCSGSMFAFTIGMLIESNQSEPYDNSLNSMYKTGFILAAVFGPMIPCGIIFKSMGGNKIQESVDRYNGLQTSGNRGLRYEFGFTSSGVGLKIFF